MCAKFCTLSNVTLTFSQVATVQTVSDNEAVSIIVSDQVVNPDTGVSSDGHSGINNSASNISDTSMGLPISSANGGAETNHASDIMSIVNSSHDSLASSVFNTYESAGVIAAESSVASGPLSLLPKHISGQSVNTHVESALDLLPEHISVALASVDADSDFPGGEGVSLNDLIGADSQGAGTQISEYAMPTHDDKDDLMQMASHNIEHGVV